jgi:hypothetical protein
MANIKIKDLVKYSDSGSLIQDLSEEELNLQGGGHIDRCNYNGKWWTVYRV